MATRPRSYAYARLMRMRKRREIRSFADFLARSRPVYIEGSQWVKPKGSR